MGILAAIALPSLLNQVNRARQAEARTYVGSINDAQKIRLIEEGDFGTLEQLGNPIPASTQNYDYVINVNPQASATITATPKVAALNPVSGLVVIQPSGTTASALCPGTLTPSIGCPQQ